MRKGRRASLFPSHFIATYADCWMTQICTLGKVLGSMIIED